MKPNLLFICFLFCINGIYAQKEHDVKSGLTEALSAQFTKEGKSQLIGKLELTDSSTLKYTANTNPENKTKTSEPESIKTIIDSVLMDIVDGFIKKINVHAEGNTYTNKYPISLINFGDRTNDRLYNKDHRQKNYIILGDFLNYHAAIGNNYTPDNIIVKLAPKLDEKNKNKLSESISNDAILKMYYLKYNDGINKLIDYRIYSDFLGMINETTNGIINFEAKAKIPVITTNIPNKNLYVFKSVYPIVRYSRFDNKDRLIEIDTSSAITATVLTNRLNILQKSFLSCGLTTDFLYWVPKNNFIEFNIPAHICFNLAENKAKTNGAILDAKENLMSLNYGAGINLIVNRSRNFMLDVGFTHSWIKHLNSYKYQLEKIPVFTVYRFSSEVSFFGDNRNNALFLRFNYTSEYSNANNFFQFQVGYKSSLNL
ncbi:hypothetical protein [Flavobacterium sp. UBA4197]|uniref:hypothetical protein n=1 Tax=Flavobacterium sp. UBA4197 TaxID=1946546 RepID=UPI00257C06B1|nr:hypothetical protein [Flavobacterium sp. UBA4197]